MAKKLRLRDFEFLIAYGTYIQLYFIKTGEVIETYAPEYSNLCDKEVVSIYPIGKNMLRISLS